MIRKFRGALFLVCLMCLVSVAAWAVVITYRPVVDASGTLPDGTAIAVSLEQIVEDGVAKEKTKGASSLTFGGKTYTFARVKPVMKFADITANKATVVTYDTLSGYKAQADLFRLVFVKRSDGKYDAGLTVWKHPGSSTNLFPPANEYKEARHSGVFSGLVDINP